MRDLDAYVRSELSAHLATHQPLDPDSFARGLTRRRRTRATKRLGAVSVVGLVLWAVAAAGVMDLQWERTAPQPAGPPRYEPQIIGGARGVQDLAIQPGTGRIWVLNGRGEVGVLEGAKVRFGGIDVGRSVSGWRAFTVGPDGALWVSSGRRLERVGPDGSVTSSTRLRTGYIRELAFGAGYLWALDAQGTLTRIAPDTLGQHRMVTVAGEFENALEHHLAVGFGAAWVGGESAGEVVRVDARTLEVDGFTLGAAKPPPGEDGAYVNAVEIGDREVWACCDHSDDVVALDPGSGAPASRLGVDSGDDEPGGDIHLASDGTHLWVAKFGYYDGFSYPGLFRADTTGIEGPSPLPVEEVHRMVAAPDGLLVLGSQSEMAGSHLIRIAYDDFGKLPYPSEPEKSRTPLVVFVVLIAGLLALVLFLGRDEPDQRFDPQDPATQRR